MDKTDVCRVVGDSRIRSKYDGEAERVRTLDSTVKEFSLEQAQLEAKRCARTTVCVYCDVCQLICPDLAITRDPESRRIVVDLDFCKGCGLCASYCPHGAISMIVDE